MRGKVQGHSEQVISGGRRGAINVNAGPSGARTTKRASCVARKLRCMDGVNVWVGGPAGAWGLDHRSGPASGACVGRAASGGSSTTPPRPQSEWPAAPLPPSPRCNSSTRKIVWLDAKPLLVCWSRADWAGAGDVISCREFPNTAQARTRRVTTPHVYTSTPSFKCPGPGRQRGKRRSQRPVPARPIL